MDTTGAEGDARRRAPDVHLVRGRAAYREGAWQEAFTELWAADQRQPVVAADLEVLAMSAYLTCRDAEAVRAMERAHARYVDTGDWVGAARCAFWISIGLLVAGEQAGSGGWVGRGDRLLDRHGSECVERGYLLVPGVLANCGAGGDLETAFADAVSIVAIGERFGDTDLVAFGLHAQGRVQIRRGSVVAGMALLDEAMVAVVAGELASPLLTGLIYCQVIDACEEVFEVRRAHEWTDALARWCQAQSQMFTFTGICLVHRAGSLQLRGAWTAAIDEARRACERFPPGEPGIGAARYRLGEIHRLRGELTAAEDLYRSASAQGWQPQPGLALLRLAQGRTATAEAAIRRVLAETTDRLGRARLLPAYVEIMLAVGDVPRARAGSRELTGIAADYGQVALLAVAEHARGAIELAAGDAGAALSALRASCQHWREAEAPYEEARVRTLVGRACQQLGDHDSAAWELAGARDCFVRLGAAPDADRATALIASAVATPPCGLTPRELQVLRLVAAGNSNRAIAQRLVLSERTVDRHVSNILTKLEVPSRTAAAAFAYEHRLV